MWIIYIYIYTHTERERLVNQEFDAEEKINAILIHSDIVA
jgi:hypothetical protein